MRLNLAKINISGMEWGKETTVIDGVLYINREKATAVCGKDPCIQEITLHIARPGESIRIMPTKDVIEPRCKITNEGSIFPGVIGEMCQAGIGGTLVLKGAAVVVTHSNDKDCVCRTNGFIDMVGPAADWCYYSKTFNLVLDVKVNPEVLKDAPEKIDNACKIAGLKLAVHLAEECRGLVPNESKVYELGDVDPNLPGVVLVFQALGQRPLIKDFWIYGQLGGDYFTPTIIHPNEFFDGAIVTYLGTYLMACSDKHINYELQNSRIIEELYKRHGKDIRFLGVILHSITLTLERKKRECLFSTKLASMLGADGAIITSEGHGNPDEDLMMCCREMEKSGISTVIISGELGGKDGRGAGLVNWTPECTAMISTGNDHELVAVPKKQDLFIGNKASHKFLQTVGIKEQPKDPDLFFTEVINILGCASEAGFYNISARWV